MFIIKVSTPLFHDRLIFAKNADRGQVCFREGHINMINTAVLFHSLRVATLSKILNGNRNQVAYYFKDLLILFTTIYFF